MMSELSEMFWDKVRRIWSLEGPNVAEVQGQGNKEMCLVFVGRMIYAPVSSVGSWFWGLAG